MGRSKFPGKPSKLVTKKRVSVLNGSSGSSSGTTSGNTNKTTSASTSSASTSGASHTSTATANTSSAGGSTTNNSSSTSSSSTSSNSAGQQKGQPQQRGGGGSKNALQSDCSESTPTTATSADEDCAGDHTVTAVSGKDIKDGTKLVVAALSSSLVITTSKATSSKTTTSTTTTTTTTTTSTAKTSKTITDEKDIIGGTTKPNKSHCGKVVTNKSDNSDTSHNKTAALTLTSVDIKSSEKAAKTTDKVNTGNNRKEASSDVGKSTAAGDKHLHHNNNEEDLKKPPAETTMNASTVGNNEARCDSSQQQQQQQQKSTSTSGIFTRTRTSTTQPSTATTNQPSTSAKSALVIPPPMLSTEPPPPAPDDPPQKGGAALKKAATKKKTVTFKSVLEVSDDVNVVKKVYNPDGTPSASIIKKESLSRAVRYAKGIVRPSRLTEILKNNANKIDKLGSLTFKSSILTPIGGNSSTFECHGAALAHSSSGEASSSVGNAGDADDVADNNVISTDVGDKRFVLPKRSAHSCRVIKPNKRFLNDLDDSHSKNGKKSSSRKGGDKKCSSIGNEKEDDDGGYSNKSSEASKCRLNGSEDDINNDCDNAQGSQTDGSSDSGSEAESSSIRSNPQEASGGPFSQRGLFCNTPATSKVILRQPRLQFTTSNTSKEGPFSLNLNSTNKTNLESSECGVCGTVASSKFTQKFGINSCEACRKFISKSVKKLAASSSISAPSMAFQCRNDCSCQIVPLSKGNRFKVLKSTMKERCHACWLKKCVKTFLIPSGLRSRIIGLLPPTMRDLDSGLSSTFSIKKELLSESSSTNIFSVVQNAKLLTWPQPSTDSGDIDLMASKLKSLSNPLSENNKTFGSTPLLKPPSLIEKPIMLESAKVSDLKIPSVAVPSTNIKQPTENSDATATITQSTQQQQPTSVIPPPPPAEVEELSRMRLRKAKDRDAPPTTTAPPPTPLSVTTVTAEQPKRQRIDLKGPRVKHVCRSASIVLGQPAATFPLEASPLLETMDTPPRPDSPQETEMQLRQSTAIKEVQQQQQLNASMCTDCTQDLALSPPATPIENQEDDADSNSLELKGLTTTKPEPQSKVTKSNLGIVPTTTTATPDVIVTTSSIVLATTMTVTTASTTITTIADTAVNLGTQKIEEILKPNTRERKRPNCVPSSSTVLSSKQLNAFSRKPIPPKVKSPLISIDFWENYDPAEVSQTGFGLIVSEGVPVRALCFLCGSYGQGPLIFCVCCCEPYHQYCVEDEYNLKHSSMLDETNSSIFDVTLTAGVSGIGGSNQITNQLNWLCPRCTVCYSCNMASGSKVKCQKCQKNYHSTCLGTSKRLSGADRPLICAHCLKCKSCGTTNVSKFVGNLPMCSSCFKLRQKGNFCPLCQKCYEENDFNLKMMECGDCRRWVHAKCEGLTDEQYNMLSVLPESIEFICVKCARCNSVADTWREAVSAEFKSGLLSVVRQLSKSRQACVLLKLSPRKKTVGCICQPMQSNRTIQFLKSENITAMGGAADMEDEESLKSDDITMGSGSGSTTGSEAFSNVDNKRYPMKCYCGATQKQVMDTVPSLLDIRRKISDNGYFSLGDFNYDMNLVINAASCDDLMTAYKEILSEAFPWFQNETKACTDALEEDMYDSCSFGHNSPTMESDQQVPMINIPDEIDDYFYTSYDKVDTRFCMFCKGIGEGVPQHEDRLLYCGQNSWVHTNCALWSAEVFEEIDGSLQNVHMAISRGRLIKCTKCGIKGATVGCNAKNCGEHFHYPCARKAGCSFLVDKTVYCVQHLHEAGRKQCCKEKNFEVLRPVYVELDRRKKKFAEPSRVQFLIGSLQVKKLGRIVAALSDNTDALVPADYQCSRLYWSSKEPWKVVEYTVRTFVQTNNITCNGDFGRNFTVDHTNNINLVALGLAQIAKWHGSLSGEETDFNTYRTERSLKHIIEVIGSGNGDETNEEEPQNNADLLPPEIKDAIFEDLPHDILDGISMLDIFPKLMTYEDMVAMDAKNEVYLNSEMMRENMCDDDLSQKDYEVDVWPTTSSGPTHVEDQLLSAVRPTMSRELKRSKSEIFPRGVAASRSHQRSSSLTWSCKLDVTAAAKRRKVARNGFSVLQDMRLPEGVLLSLSRRKEDFPSSVLDKRRSSIQAVDDIKTKTFTWSASKRLNQIDETTDTSTTNASHQPDSFDKLKISQLDGGIDEASSSSEGGNSPMHKFGNHFDSPVKCDRCHCSYRTQDSYQRHLTTCEPLSTSESESEATPRSPDMQTQQTQQSCNVYVATSMPMVQDMCNMPIFSQQQQPQHQQNSLSSILNNNAFTSQNINHINQLVQNQLAGLQGMGCQTQQYNPNLQQSLQAQIQNSMHGTNVQNAGIPITHLNQSNMLLAQSQSNTQQQMFAQPINVNLQSQLFPLQNITTQTTTNINQYSTNTSALDHLTQNNMLQSKGVQQQRINTNQHMPLSLQSASNQQYNQPQLIQISSGSNPQIMTLTTAPTHNLNTIRQIQPQQQQNLQQSQTSPHKNQLILPQPDKMFNKKHSLPRIQQSPVNRGKGKVPVKATPVKRNIVKNEQKPVQIINQNVPIMRSVNQTDGIVIQQSPSNQQMLMQQLSSPQTNLMSYMTADGNTMQYIAMPTAQEYKPAQPQYLTSNQLMPGTFQLQQDASGNFVLANTPALQVLPGGTLQLAQPQQPQVIGTLIQPQGLQCGMMSAEQMMLGSTPTLEVVATNPSQGCMLLTNQPVYYGLETIVQNTVMSSQQFVSTAMQGVLSQNSSFSATTTQVFQASKIEPILEVPTGYVVLNNVGDNQMQLQHATSQPNILSANVLQSAVPQIQQTPTNQIQPQTTWRFIDDNGAMQTATVSSAAANSIHMTTHQMHTVSTPKATITTKTPTVMPKMTSQIQISKTTTTPSNTNNHMVTNNNLLRPIMNSIESQEVTMSNMPPPKSVASTMEVISAMTGMHATSAVSTSSLTITPTSTSLMSNHHQPKPSTITSSSSSSITVTAPCAATTPPVNVTQSPLQMSIQPIQRKTNMIRPITNGSKSSITVKPKVIGKPVAAKSQKAQSKMGATHLVPTTAPVTIQSYLHTEPETLLTENLNVLHKSQMLDAKFSSIEISYKVEEPTVTSVPSSSSASNDIVNFQSSITTNASQSSVSSKTATTNCAILSISIPNQSNLSTQANTLLQAVPQMQQIGGINLPTSASIQLPSAPYATPYSNGIPTNVVNPIQQNNSRPMNRVLPMQTVQQKASPPTPPEPKVLSESGHDIKFQDITNETTKIEQSLSASDMTSSPIIVITTDKSMSSPMSSTNDQAHSDVPTEDEFDSGKFDAMDFMDQDDSLPAFDKLKAESNGMMDREDDRTSPEVKKKICAILVNLENDDCGSGKHMMDTSPCGSSTASPFRLSVSTEVEPINNNVVMAEHRITKEEEKENSIQQITEELLMKLQKPITTVVTPKPSSESIAQLQKPNTPSILFEIQSQDGFSYKSSSITEIWEKVFESVQMARKAHGLSQLPEGPLADMCGYQMLGLKTNALKYLLEQLPGAERCTKYTPRYHKRPLSIASHSGSSGYLSDLDDYKENIKGAVRCEAYVSRSEYDMFSWLASRHRKQPVQIVVQSESEIAPRRGSGSNLPMAMRYRTLKETYKESVGVYRSHIHGRGLFCIKDIEAGEMVIEYAGELIRSTLTDKRERYYDGKGIGCYMFKIDDNLVVDATMRGNAARFINHSCEPNCYSKVVDILGHKHIIIFALRRIVQGEELTYDYKFPFEDVKIPCSCGSKRCRKYLN